MTYNVARVLKPGTNNDKEKSATDDPVLEASRSGSARLAHNLRATLSAY